MRTTFKLLSIAEEALLTEDELVKYYDEKVNYYKKVPINILYLEFVKAIRRPLVKIASKMGNYKLVYLNDLEVPEEAYIIATNHKGFNDLPILLEAVEEPFFVLAACDVPMPLNLIIVFKLLGVINVDRRNRKEKQGALERASKISARGYNIAYFPEAVNNFSESILYPFWPGVIDNAKNSNRPILPIATFDKGDKVYVKFGKPIKVNPSDNRDIAVAILRDDIATLLWDIWESIPLGTREEAIRTYKPPNLSVGNLIFDPQYESQFIYRPPNPYSPDKERWLTIEEVTDIDHNIRIAGSKKMHEISFKDYYEMPVNGYKEFNIKDAYEKQLSTSDYGGSLRLIKRKEV